jgi:hypothetical protein
LVYGPPGLSELPLARRRQLEKGGSPVVRIGKPSAVAEGPKPVSQLARAAGRYAKPGREVLHATTLGLRYHGHGFEQNQGQAALTSEAKVHRGHELCLDTLHLAEYASQVGHGHLPLARLMPKLARVPLLSAARFSG